MKLYVLAGCYTDCMRGSTGELCEEMYLFKTKDEAIEKLRTFVNKNAERSELPFLKDKIKEENWPNGDDEQRLSTTIASAEYDNIAWNEGGDYRWEIREFDLQES